MRAVLIAAVLMTAFWCLAGGVSLTVYLVAVGARSVRDHRRGFTRAYTPPPGGVVALLIGYACFMVVIAALTVWAREEVWVGMASWSALVAFATVVVLRRRRSPEAR